MLYALTSIVSLVVYLLLVSITPALPAGQHSTDAKHGDIPQLRLPAATQAPGPNQMDIRADSTFTVSPPNSTPALSQTSSVEIFTDSACYTVSYLVSSCILASPGFTTFEPSLQASCLCYSSTFFDPSLFDGPATTCAQFLSTAAPQSLSDIAPFTGFCTSVGVGNPISPTSEPSEAATSSIPPQSSETSISGFAPTTVSTIISIGFYVPTPTTSPSPLSARPPQGKSNPEILNFTLRVKDLTLAQEIGIAVGSLVIALIAGYGSVFQPY